MASAVPAFPSTKETTNYARLCRLLVDVGCHVLRERFDQIHSPAGLYTVLSNPAVHATVDSLRKKRVLNPSQWGKLYPVIRSSVTSVNFDITLLMVLLRSICGLTPPATGWDNLPPATDLTLEADIARVKCYSNRMYGHASHASVDDVTFSTCWKDTTDTIVRLGGLPYRAVVDNLKYDLMDRDIEDHYKELLRQWKVDEDNIKIKLEEVGDSATLAPGGTLKGLTQMPSFFLDSMQPMTTVPNLEAGKTADKGNSGKECQPAEIKDWNLLHSAVEGGDVSIIEMTLSRGFDVNSKDSLGRTPLMIAAAKGKKQAVDFLLSKGADPSLKTLTEKNLLHAAVEGGNVAIVETVLSLDIPVNSIDKDGLTPLMIAVSNNKLETLEFLLSNGADPFLKDEKERNVLNISAECGCTDVIERLLSSGMDIDSRDDKGQTPLMDAAAFAKLQVVNYLLEKGADPTLTANNGWSLLHFACQGGNTTIIEKILSCRLDVNIKGTYGESTPLIAAIVNNNLEAVKYLLKEGADPTLEFGFKPINSLHLAVIDPASTSHVVSIIEAILASGLSINVRSSKGLIALMLAALVEKPEVVDFLLLKGADPHLEDTFGWLRKEVTSL